MLAITNEEMDILKQLQGIEDESTDIKKSLGQVEAEITTRKNKLGDSAGVIGAAWIGGK